MRPQPVGRFCEEVATVVCSRIDSDRGCSRSIGSHHREHQAVATSGGSSTGPVSQAARPALPQGKAGRSSCSEIPSSHPVAPQSSANLSDGAARGYSHRARFVGIRYTA